MILGLKIIIKNQPSHKIYHIIQNCNLVFNENNFLVSLKKFLI